MSSAECAGSAGSVRTHRRPRSRELSLTTADTDRPDLEDVRRAVADIEGWLSDDQLDRLYAAAGRLGDGGRIVEIGSFRGRSTVVLALSAPQAGEVVAIDPHAGNDRGPQQWDGFAEEASLDNKAFEANLEAAGVRDRVRHVRAFSDRALDDVEGTIDILYIDGAHRYKPARADIESWGSRIPQGGTLLIHDAFSSVGVTAAIARTLFLSSRFEYLGRSRSMVEYRAERIRGKARWRSTGRQLAQLPWFVRNLVIKVLMTLRLGALARVLGHDGETWPY